MLRQYDFFGDSLTAGTIEGCSMIQGALGGYFEIVMAMLGLLAGIGPLISPGLQPVSLALQPFPTTIWGFTTGGNAWTAIVAATDAFSRLPQGYGCYGSGAGKVATFTKPAKGWKPIVGFDLWFVDIAGGGNWSYRIDGGAWTAMGQTLGAVDGTTTTNKLCKFYVNLPVNSTVEIRCADTSGTSVLCCPSGITPYYVVPQTATTGIIGNNFSTNGASLHLNAGTQAGGGDHLAVLDDVHLGTGSPISSRPNAGTVQMFINDVELNNTSQFATEMGVVNTRASVFGKVYFLIPWEVETTDYPQAQQTAYRNITESTAAGFATPATTYNFYTKWSQMGYVGNAGSIPNLASDGGLFLHQNQRGNIVCADPVYWMLRNDLGAAVGSVGRAFYTGSSFVGGTDVLGGSAGALLRNITDVALGSDAAAGGGAGSHFVSDPGLGADVLTRLEAQARTLADVALGADAVTRTGSDTRPASDVGLGGDTATRAVVWLRQAPDSSVGGDTVTEQGTRARGVTDVALGGDAAAGTGAGGAQLRTLADSALSADMLIRSYAAHRTLADSGIGNDTLTTGIPGGAPASGTVTVRSGPSARVAVRQGPTVTVAVGGSQ